MKKEQEEQLRYENDKKSTAVAILLTLFVGGLGIHRFYLGKTGNWHCDPMHDNIGGARSSNTACFSAVCVGNLGACRFVPRFRLCAGT